MCLRKVPEIPSCAFLKCQTLLPAPLSDEILRAFGCASMFKMVVLHLVPELAGFHLARSPNLSCTPAPGGLALMHLCVQGEGNISVFTDGVDSGNPVSWCGSGNHSALINTLQ